MAFNLVQAVEARVSPKTVEHVASHIGEDTTTTRAAMSTGVLAIVAGLTQSASSDSGAADLLSSLRAHEPLGATDEELEPHTLHERGQALVAGHFGGRAGAMADTVARSTGLGRQQSASIVSMLAPLVTGVLAREVASRGLDAGGLGGLLRDERASMLARRGLPTGLGEALRGEHAGEAAPAQPVAGEVVRPEVALPKPAVAADARKPELRAVPPDAPTREVHVERPRVAPETTASRPIAAATEHRKAPVGWIVALAGAAALLVLGLLFSSSQRGATESPTARVPEPSRIEPPAGPQVPHGPMVPGVPAPAAPREPTSETTTTGAAIPAGDPLAKHFAEGGPTPDRVETALAFERSTAALTGDGATEIEHIATLMKQHPTARIRLEGPADGASAYDEKLARARAEKVKGMLVERGVDGARVETAAASATKPLTPGERPGQARRVDIVVIQR
ncbi:MAG: DUF937 domain-containing protein [Labilithrix sp.]|nr:DUF937 domain-containing protein [Labilithrix sp.]